MTDAPHLSHTSGSLSSEANNRSKAASPPPFSLRLSDAERARLKSEAGPQPLGTYIRARLLADPARPIRRPSGLTVEDRKALAQALALLGQSRIASNLNQLAYWANSGALDLVPETLAQINATVAHVAAIRRLLMEALGLKPGGAP